MDSKIEQLVAITGSTADVARALLEACGDNLELAVNMHMEGGVPGNTSGEPGPSSAHASEPLLSPTSYEAKHGVRAPIPQSSGVLLEESAPTRRRIAHRRLPTTVFDPFQDYRNTGKIRGPGDARKKQSLAELFKPPHDIMFQGTFQEAKLYGQQQQKWLLVNIQDSKEFPCQVLNRDVWSNHNVKEIVKQHFVFWQVYCITDEGLKFKQLYHVDKYPYIAVIDPITGEKMVNWHELSISKLTDAVLDFLANNQFQSQLPKNKQHVDGIAERSEDSLLEEAIKASLTEAQKMKKSRLVFSDDSDVECVSLSSPSEQDSGDIEYLGQSVGGETTSSNLVKTSSNLVERDSVGQYSRDMLNGHTEGKRPGGRRSRKRLSSNNEVIDELPCKLMKTDISSPPFSMSINTDTPPLSCPDSEAAGGEVCRILFRLPDGSRLQHQFLTSTTIKDVFSFLKTKDINYEDHVIVTQFPRRNLCESNHATTLKDLGLHLRDTIFIHTSE